jgi:hypothetical protein
VATPRKWPAGGAFSSRGNTGDFDRGREVRGIEVFDGRDVEQFRARAREQRGVLLFAPGITLEVFAGRKLERVDEDRHDGEPASLPGQAHEGEMTLVQGPHRRNKADRCAAGTRFADERPQGRQIRDGVHETSFQLSAISVQLFRIGASLQLRLRAES